MNIKTTVCSFLAILFFMSCDDSTSRLGTSLTPDDDAITVIKDSCYATSRTIPASDSLIIMTSQCNLGRFTEQVSGSTLQAGYLTQLGCMENFSIPDSVYGIGNHHFPKWFVDEIGDNKPYYAELKLYYKSYFGDSTNTIKIEIFPLDKMLDGNTIYYPDTDPSLFCDLQQEPMASITVSGWNLQEYDSIRSSSKHYPTITVPLPDSIARKILESYFNPETRHYFSDATSFMENLIKGFYIRCTQGDGTIFYIDRTILDVNFKYINYDDYDEPRMESRMAEFYGNKEVIQFNCFKWTGLEEQLADNDFTWIRTPFGLLTEITLPIDDMRDNRYVLNAAQLCMSTANTPSSRFKPSVPSILMLIRKDNMQSFFGKNSTIDNSQSYAASYSSKYGTYTFDNIAALVEKAYNDRLNWLEDNNMKLDDQGKQAYQAAYPNWNKVILVPVTPTISSTNTVISYSLDIKMHQVKLLGGPNNKIKIKTIRSRF